MAFFPRADLSLMHEGGGFGEILGYFVRIYGNYFNFLIGVASVNDGVNDIELWVVNVTIIKL